MKILVYGAGAIGSYIGVNLIRAANEVTFVGRESFVTAARERGLTITLPQGGEWRMSPVYAVTVLRDALPRGPFDATFLTIKSHTLDVALEELSRFRAVVGQIVCMQNGVGVEERVAAVLGQERVIAGTLTSPVSAREPNVFALDKLLGGIGYAALGQNVPFADKLARTSFTDLMPATRYDDARAMKWSKLLLNIVGNATSAVFGLSVETIYADPTLFSLEMRMVRECAAVMRASGVPILNLPGYRARAFARVATLLPDGLAKLLLARRVAQGRGGKWPSFYFDARDATGRSEVTALNGQIVENGAARGVPTPVNSWLTQTLLAIVSGRRAQGDPRLWGEARRLVV